MLTIHDCEQNTPEWMEARRGKVTASELSTVLAKGRDGGVSVTRKTYMMKLAGEILTGEAMESYSNAYMERGHFMEDAARQRYAFDRDAEPYQVGFISNGRRGCSPDSLLGSDGLLEIKTKAAHLHIEALLRGDFPPEHKAQCQGQLWIAEREWVDLVVYWPKLPLLVFRATRDEAYIKTLSDGVDAFTAELDALVERVRRYGEPDRVAA